MHEEKTSKVEGVDFGPRSVSGEVEVKMRNGEQAVLQIQVEKHLVNGFRPEYAWTFSLNGDVLTTPPSGAIKPEMGGLDGYGPWAGGHIEDGGELDKVRILVNQLVPKIRQA